MDNCPICKLEVSTQVLDRDSHLIRCPRCGNYQIEHTARAILFGGGLVDARIISNASGWIRENPGAVISEDHIKFFKKLKTPTVAQKADKLLLFLAKWYPIPGQTFKIPQDIDLADPSFLSITWSFNTTELSFIIHDYLIKNRNYLTRQSQTTMEITTAGWGHIDSLYQVDPDSQIAFVAMWFDKRLDELYLRAIHPGIEAAGYEPLRIDLHQHNNRIDDEIIAMIRRSKFLVAELTGLRGGVYFEAGYALGMGLQVIWICDEEELGNIHFDTRQFNFITWNEAEVDKLKDVLQFRIERTLGRGNYKPASSN